LITVNVADDDIELVGTRGPIGAVNLMEKLPKMTDEKKPRSKATGQQLKQQVIGVIDRNLARLTSPRDRMYVLEYLLKQAQDEVRLESANAAASRPFPVNGTLKQNDLFGDL
jgi:hypothetical protein